MVGRSEGKGEEKQAEEMSDEAPGINQTSLKGPTQPCRAPSSEPGLLPAGKEQNTATHHCLLPPCSPSCASEPPGSGQCPALAEGPSAHQTLPLAGWGHGQYKRALSASVSPFGKWVQQHPSHSVVLCMPLGGFIQHWKCPNKF